MKYRSSSKMGYLPSPASGGGHIVNKEKIFTNIKVL
jgi:hypothetical protein